MGSSRIGLVMLVSFWDGLASFAAWVTLLFITSDVIFKYFQVPWDLRPRINPFRASKKRLASLLSAKVTLPHGVKETSKKKFQWMSTAFISTSNVWLQYIAGLPLLEIHRNSTVQGRNPSPHQSISVSSFHLRVSTSNPWEPWCWLQSFPNL